MGFYIRKSLRVGPVRFNLSKSGVGTSVGVKGFRLGTGPRGNYIHMGRGGLYYRATLPGLSSRPRIVPTRPAIPPNETHEPLQPVDTGDVLRLHDATAGALLAELNAKRRKLPTWYIGALALLAAPVALAQLQTPQWLTLLTILVGVALTIAWRSKDHLARTTVLFYDLEGKAEQTYAKFVDIFEQMAACGAIWHVEAEGKVIDRKRQAGATSIVNRKRMRLRSGSPPLVSANIPIPTVPVGAQTLYLLPDRLLVFAKEGVGAVNYRDLAVKSSATRFIEGEGVPRDATVVDYTWR